MKPSKLQREYADLIARAHKAGEEVGIKVSGERRTSPRFQVETGDLWINSVPSFQVLDVSISGIAIASSYPLRPGDMIDVVLGGNVKAQATVMGCRLVDSATQYTDAEFRINCRFAEPERGMELLVNAKRRKQPSADESTAST
jgi:PilZ domain